MKDLIEYYIQEYNCENKMIAKIVIPQDATKDDLKGIREMLDVVIKRHFKEKVRIMNERMDCNNLS